MKQQQNLIRFAIDAILILVVLKCTEIHNYLIFAINHNIKYKDSRMLEEAFEKLLTTFLKIWSFPRDFTMFPMSAIIICLLASCLSVRKINTKQYVVPLCATSAYLLTVFVAVTRYADPTPELRINMAIGSSLLLVSSLVIAFGFEILKKKMVVAVHDK
jgi:hypothetical protein